MTRRRRELLLLAAILCAGFALRGWLAWGSPLRADVFFDERFSFRNVRSLVAEGSLRPNNAYYPSLSFLPHAALLAASEGLHRATGGTAGGALSIYAAGGDGFSATAYGLARGVSVAAGTLCILLVFVLGRRLFDARAGLLAAVILAAAPIHILTSARFKPDILVDLFALLTLWWTLRAAERPTPRAFLASGCGVGLAAASKYNGAGVALAVAAGILAAGREARRWAGLAAAGVASIAVFLALNPFPDLVAEYLGRQMEMYGDKGAAEGLSHWQVLVRAFGRVRMNLGWPLTLFAGAGAAGMAARLVRPGTGPRQRSEAAAVLGLLVGFPVLYAATTNLFRGHNVLPVVACSALLAAWPAIAAWNRVAAALGEPGRLARRAAALAAAAVFAAILFADPVRVVYRRVMPTTGERAEQILAARLQPIHLRMVIYEAREASGPDADGGREAPGGPAGGERLRPRRGEDLAATFPVTGLTEVDSELLAGADAEVFTARELEGADSSFYYRRLAAGADGTQRIEAEAFRRRGLDLGVVLHPWTRVGGPVELRFEPGARRGRWRAVPAEGGLIGPVPAGFREAGGAVSLSLWLPFERGAGVPRAVRIAGRETVLAPTGSSGGRVRFLTGRVPVPGTGETGGIAGIGLELVGEAQRPDPARVDGSLHFWLPEPRERADADGAPGRRFGSRPG